MPTTVTAHFITGIYSGHHADRTVFPPSPARLISALVAAAHQTPEITDAARDVLQLLCEAQPPTLVVPPAYKSGETQTFMQRAVSTTNSKLRYAKDGPLAGNQRIMGEFGGKVQKRVNGHFLVTGDLHFAWDDVDLNDKQYEILTRVAYDIPYLGRECDLVLIHVSRASLPQLVARYNTTHAVYAPMPHGGMVLRVPSPAFLSWLDNRYASTFGKHAREPIPVDHRVRVAHYAPVATIPESDEMLVTIPFARPLNINKALSLAAKVHPDGEGTTFPLTRSGNKFVKGEALGLGVITTGSVHLDEDFDADHLGEDTGSVVLQPSYWTRPAQVWMTATAFVGHPDKWVASQQVLQAVPGAVILEISKFAVRAGQQHVETGPTQQAWHVVFRTPEAAPGPIFLDHDNGTGVCIPDYKEKAS